MRKGMLKKILSVTMSVVILGGMTGCGSKTDKVKNIAEDSTEQVLTFFTPNNPFGMSEELEPRAVTMLYAEQKIPGLKIEYNTYRAKDYKEKTYDEVLVERARANKDDIYYMNPDDIATLGKEGKLADLSGLSSAKNLRDFVREANTVDGKLVAIPQNIVTYGLFLNKDLFDKYNLDIPKTPEDLLNCCKVFKENGIEYPIGANRWWLECFVFANGYDELYLGDGDVDEKIEKINKGEAKYSDYLRNGFEYLKTLIDKGYIDAKTALTYEAMDGEGPAFKEGKTPIVTAYWAAANNKSLYGDLDFNLDVIGFPSRYGNVALINCNGISALEDSPNKELALKTINTVVSDKALKLYNQLDPGPTSSKNVETEYTDELEPLYQCVNNGKNVLTTNASMDVEQWGNVCEIVRDLMGGASVDECCKKLDALQEGK